MKLNKVLCLFLMLTIVLSFASCKLFIKHNVEFDSDGGSPIKTQVVKHGDPATEPAVPFKDGYTFLGWFNGDEQWDFSTPIKEDVKLVAHWEKDESDPTDPVHVDADDDGKCDDCGIDYTDGTDLPESYRIAYMDGNTNIYLQPSSYTSDSVGLVLPTPNAKAHYDFVGWFTDPELTQPATEINVNSNKNLVFYAKFVPTAYTVTYVLDGGVNNEANPATYTFENLPLSFAAPTKDGYDFQGWYTDANCTESISGITLESAGNITVYALWEKAPASFVVTYLDNNGNVISTETLRESADDQPIKNEYELEGYTFLGWLDADGNKVTVIPAGHNTDLTLKADMQENIVTAKVIYYINGVETHSENFAVETGLAALMSANKGGYTFDGWYAHPEYTGEKVTSIPAGTTENVNLYGKYTANTYTVKYYDKDGNELLLAPSTYQISETATALPVAPSIEGHTTLGWYNEAGDKYTSIPANSYGDLALYAKYEATKYTVTYVLNGGENHDQNLTEYAHGNLPTLHDPLSRSGYLFSGWYTDPTFSAGSLVEDFSNCANRNVVLYAKWLTTSSGSDGDGSTTTPEVPF